ncbi:TetR/AcrR family transcriptional regulator [Streptacidiphilus rugosus]|uniref:TetR/AcrR family transcriptional regulator n=1 Tax=Streptacidiphilus rugosus TaxID=405783 RepID=UPI00068A4BA4|nr:TetR/AcrR family transcriptional regulator [Streptacidiphilus rugosus]
MSGERDAPAPREQRKIDTRERLLRVATELFVARGFEETTYDDIARAAAVARQTVFNHFPRKEDFIHAWSVLRREEIAQALTDRAFLEQPATARLVLIMRVMADSYERSPAAGRVYTLAWVKWGGPVLEERALASQFALVIEEGQRSGEIRDDVGAQTAGELIRAAYFDALWRWAAPDRPADAPSLFADLVVRLELILTGICAMPDREGLKRSMRLVQAVETAATHEGQGKTPSDAAEQVTDDR